MTGVVLGVIITMALATKIILLKRRKNTSVRLTELGTTMVRSEVPDTGKNEMQGINTVTILGGSPLELGTRTS